MFSDIALRRLAEEAQKLHITDPRLETLILEAIESFPSARSFDPENLLLLIEEEPTDFDAIRDEIDRLRDAVRRSTFGQTRFRDFVFSDTSWFVDNWIPHSDVSLLTSPPGIGKSFLALQIAMAAVGETNSILVPDGREQTFGSKLPFSLPEDFDPQRAVIVHWEDTFDMVSRRRYSIHQEFAIQAGEDPDTFIIPEERMEASDNLLTLYMPDLGPRNAIWAPPRLSHVDTIGELTDSGKRLRDRISEHRSDFVIIDTATHAFQGNINERAAVAPFLSYLQTWAREDNICILVIDHPPKSNENSYSGSVAWLGIVRSLITIAKDEVKAGDVISVPCPSHPRGRKNCDDCYEENIETDNVDYYIHHVKSSFGKEQGSVAATRSPRSGVWQNEMLGVL